MILAKMIDDRVSVSAGFVWDLDLDLDDFRCMTAVPEADNWVLFGSCVHFGRTDSVLGLVGLVWVGEDVDVGLVRPRNSDAKVD